MKIDPQFQRRLLAASGFSLNSLFSRKPSKSLRNCRNPRKNCLLHWLFGWKSTSAGRNGPKPSPSPCGYWKWNPKSRIGWSLLPMRPGGAEAWFSLMKSCGKPARIFPNCGTIQFNLACYAAQLGQLGEARQRLCRAISSTKDSRPWRRLIPISSRSGMR